MQAPLIQQSVDTSVGGGYMCNILVIVEKDACQWYCIMDVYMIIILSDNCQLPLYLLFILL